MFTTALLISDSASTCVALLWDFTLGRAGRFMNAAAEAAKGRQVAGTQLCPFSESDDYI